MAIKIISSRQYLFEKEEYVSAPDDEKKTDLRHRHVSDKIVVRALQAAQNVPDWVGETDLFKIAVQDGTIVKVDFEGSSPSFAVNNDSKAGLTGSVVPVADLASAGPSQPASNGQNTQQSGTGWGAGPK